MPLAICRGCLKACLPPCPRCTAPIHRNTKGTNVDNEDNPHQPSPSFRPNRRVCPSDLKVTIKALKRALRKEEKRADKMHALNAQIEELHGRLTALRRA